MGFIKIVAFGAVTFVVAVIIAYVLAAKYNANDSSLDHSQGDRLVTEMPECPEVWQDIPLYDDTVYRVPPEGLSVPRLTTNVPEFHDCQKFLLLERGRAESEAFVYDSLYAIFAYPGLAWIVDTLEALHSNGAPRPAIAAAEIYTFGKGYAPLGIGANFNCLYLYVGAERGTLAAKMVQVGAKEEQCGAAIDPRSVPGKDLVVRRTPERGYSTRDYPTAARWDWSTAGNQQYIGIRCGDAWCEIGDPSFASSPQYAGSSTNPAAHVVQIKGWYDEQVLADTGPLRPGAVTATIIPDPALRTFQFDTLGAKTWTTVAHVALNGSSQYYARKFNFFPAAVSSELRGMNRIELCYGTRRDCGVPKPSDPNTLSVYCGGLDRVWSWLPSWPQRIWWARFTAASGARPLMYRCITRRTHAGMGMGSPGTTRWRFLGDDETQWVDCRQGCCETETDMEDPT
jgi:hypothetical protein